MRTDGPGPDIALLVADLVRSGAQAELVGRVAAAFVALAGQVAAGSAVSEQLVALRSKGAERTARWRARKAALAAGGVVTSQAAAGDASDGGVTLIEELKKPPQMAEIVRFQGRESEAGAGERRHAAGTVTSPGDAVTQKEIPPHPLKKNTTLQSLPPRRKRHAVTARPVAYGATMRVKVTAGTPLFRELVALFGPVPDRGGWYFEPDRVAEAERRLQSAVAILPVGGRDGPAGAGEDGQPAGREPTATNHGKGAGG